MRTVGEAVVDHDSAPLSIDVELNGVAACFVDFMLEEDALDALGVLGKGSEPRKEVAIATLALLDVVGVDVIVKREVSFSVDVAGPSPLVGFPLALAGLVVHHGIEDARHVSRPVRVFKGLAGLDHRLVVNSLQSLV